MGSIGDWLRYARIHSAAATWALMVIGFALAGGNIFSLDVVPWILLAIAWHGSGFMQNSFHDLKWDQKDPGKKHFPLVNGALDLDDGLLGVMALTGIQCFLAGWLVRGNILALAVFGIATVSGMAYNWFSKKSPYAFLWLVLGWGSFPIIPYIVLHGTLDLTGFLFLCLFWAHFIVNCGPESSMKDLDSTEDNIVKRLGGRLGMSPTFDLQDWFHSNWKISALAIVPKFVAIILGGFLLFSLGSGWGLFVYFYGVLAIVSFLYTVDLVHSGLWKDSQKTFECVMIEMTAAFSIVVMLTPIWGWLGTIVMIIAPLLYFIGVNRATWGGKTVLTPQV